MKNNLLCIGCVFIFNLCCLFLVLAEDAVPTVTTTENISRDSGEDEEKKNVQSEENDLNLLEPSVAGSYEKIQEDGETFSKQLFAEATSQNSGVANEITTSGQPVVVTLTDAATAELQQRAAIIPTSQQQQTNNNNDKTSSSIGNRTNEENTKINNDFQSEEINNNQTSESKNSSLIAEEALLLKTKENLTEEIPSFSEWAQKQLEQAEKNKEPSNASAHQHQNMNGGSGGGGKQAKLRWKNYASLDCGAKVVASNPEAVSPSAILSPSRDEYKLNTCTSRIWFIVELCEAIQAKKIDLANFELFSSSPKDFVVSVSDRFPTREWSIVGQFTAKDERDVQSFDLNPHLFGKYIKVEVKSHYGSEHYCPISLFRVFGTSEFEVLQKEDPVHADRLEEEEDDDDDDETLDDVKNGDASKNLFSSATDAVISMVKKAAEVLGNKGNHSNQTEPSNVTDAVKVTPLIRMCTSPSHLVVCDNCTDVLFGEIYELLSCARARIGALLDVRLILDGVLNSNVCKKFGFEFVKEAEDRASFVRAFFPDRYLGAMCNTIAVIHNKVVLNVSSNYLNITTKVEDEIVNIETSEPHVIMTEVETMEEKEITDALVLETVSETKSTCSTDVSYVSQIKPTKTLTSELHLKVSSDTESNVEDGSKVVVPTETLQLNTTTTVEEVTESEKIQEVENLNDSVEEDPLEHLISELNGDGGHQMPNAQTTASPNTPQVQKESVFLRLSNRIKALERNMSLSGQYLEELSKRYKKQVEEMQKILDKTILSINEENKKKDEYNKQLEDRLMALTAAIDSLLAEKSSWSSTLYCVIVSSLVTLFIVTFCYNKNPDTRVSSTSMDVSSATKVTEVKRRKSIDVVTHSMPQKKRRRPSDQALKIVRCSTESQENTSHHQQQRKKKKRKHLVLVRSNSIGTLNEESTASASFTPADWVEAKHIEEIPFALEESEHSSLEPLATTTTIAAPSFLKTAVTSRAIRVNGDVVTRKSASVDESSRKSTSPVPSINGSVSLGEGHDAITPKKEKKGLKKILKKVF